MQTLRTLRYHRQVDNCPGTDIPCRNVVGGRRVAARHTSELGLCRPVPFVDRPTLRAFPTGISSINQKDAHAFALRFVLDESAKLSECPAVESRSLPASGRNPLANAPKFFESNGARGAFRRLDKTLGNYVVGVGPETGFPAGDSSKFSPSRAGASLLKIPSPARVATTVFLNAGTGVNLSVGINRQIYDAEIDSKHIGRVSQWWFREITNTRDVPFTPDVYQVYFPLAVSKECSLALTAHEGDFESAGDGPKRDPVFADEPEDAIIVRLCSVPAVVPDSSPVRLVGISDLSNCTYGGLCGKTETLAYLAIGKFVQVVLPEDSGLECLLRQPVGSFVHSFQRGAQCSRLFGVRLKLDVRDKFHYVKYGVVKSRLQDGAPPRPEDRGLCAEEDR